LALAATTLVAQAQTVGEEPTALTLPTRTAICDHLAATGRVAIHQDARLEALVAPAADHIATSTSQSASVEKQARITASGFRIRVFSGNEQTASKRRAYAISQEIQQKYPDLDLYIYFKTPNWRLTAGNFRTREEAYAMMVVLKKEFPHWGREMFIIADEIELPLDD
jgi:hypothetical protein